MKRVLSVLVVLFAAVFLCFAGLQEAQAATTIPATVTYIDHYAFENCTGLEKVMISDLVAWCAIEFRIGSSNPLSNGAKLLLNGEEIKGTLTIPEGVTKVGDYAFYNYNPITELVIPDAVTEIGISAFNGCSIARLELGNGIVSVDNGAFYNCTSMQYVDIPDISFWLSVSFGNRYSNPLFAAGYAKLRVGGEAVTVVKVPKEVTWIRPYVFAGYKALTDVMLMRCTCCVIPCSRTGIPCFKIQHSLPQKRQAVFLCIWEPESVILLSGTD